MELILFFKLKIIIFASIFVFSKLNVEIDTSFTLFHLAPLPFVNHSWSFPSIFKHFENLYVLVALCHNGTLGRLESLCCSMQLAFEQYVANKMEMVKMMWMIIMIMIVMMATMMMSEMTRDQCDDPLWMELH